MLNALKVSVPVALFCVTDVTLEPRAALMSTLPEPELVIEPALLTDAPESVIPLAMALLLFRMRFPVPFTPPETVRIELPLALLFVRVVPEELTVRAVRLIVKAEVVLFSVTAVTLEPMPPLIVTRPEPAL